MKTKYFFLAIRFLLWYGLFHGLLTIYFNFSSCIKLSINLSSGDVFFKTLCDVQDLVLLTRSYSALSSTPLPQAAPSFPMAPRPRRYQNVNSNHYWLLASSCTTALFPSQWYRGHEGTRLIALIASDCKLQLYHGPLSFPMVPRSRRYQTENPNHYWLLASSYTTVLFSFPIVPRPRMYQFDNPNLYWL